ncbi:RNA polymerase sigma factor [Planctomicrobium piriforme]|uniref:RNA polymerase sigma-70 factor, ECF subfamily n=1 Tax=Planctomicrobium piriforme TaxID=1576369 RepID=A0A1I3J8T7_9PLAN|nr:RNA polymerase sigma factor [Planctomicrobium piriforme]SFI56652.1 RNA polymerase sigma-70 factor, ECF subfamily [Planctomicrobium piriforme]
MSKDADRELVKRVRAGDQSAWQQLIAQYEGRLQAFVVSRLQDRTLAEDVVQETFLGFLTSLPNYNDATPVESFLFAIAAYKLTDVLRRDGRRPTLVSPATESSSGPAFADGRARRASSFARSRELQQKEESLLTDVLRSLIQTWKTSDDWERLKCLELLFVNGLPNKDAAARLQISEQAVANHKQFLVGKLKEAAKRNPHVTLDLDRLGAS